ncbi:alpha-galactosidase [Streptococcus pneumoniae]|nr:alpha-galactosidase [Streptococcus pneumoniae]
MSCFVAFHYRSYGTFFLHKNKLHNIYRGFTHYKYYRANDLGMMRYFPQVWASDNTDAIARLPIQYGSSYLYPTISMGAHVSAVPNHQMGRMTPLETRGLVAMMGNLGYELDLTNLSDEEKATIANQVNLYKELRPVVQLGQQYRLINPDTASNEAAVQFNYGNQTIVTYVRVLSVVETMETTLKLKDLDEEGLYKLQENGEVYSGAELMYAGLTVILSQGDFLSRQYIFRKL